MIPNVICAIVDKTQFDGGYSNKAMQVVEQIGRYACMLFMIFNIPYTYFGFWFSNAFIVYLSVGGALLVAYCVGWIVFKKGRSKVKMLYLSITPTLLFLFCGIVISSIPLIAFAVLFGIGHITISSKNSV